MSSDSLLPPQTLAGKIAIVTGSSRGIGAVIALDLARRGAKVLITYTSSASSQKAKAVVDEINSLDNGACATAFQGDLRDAKMPAMIVHETATAFGGVIDILVNNAAAELNKPLGAITVDEFANIYDLNVRAPTLLTQAVLPCLRRPGRIINISSVGGRAGFANLSMYCSSKAALEGLTRCWATELGSDGTTVNAVAPGPIESEMLENIPKDILESQLKNTPVGHRFGTEVEIANVVSWLAGPDSRWVSGQTLSVSGGCSMY